MAQDIVYTIIYTNRKTLSLEINRNMEVIVRSPKNMPLSVIRRFVNKNQKWLAKQHQRLESASRLPAKKPFSDAEKKKLIEEAKSIFAERAQYYAKVMEVSYNDISIREQKTRWGSCSSLKNLNFNWRLILAPEEVLNYVVVHELAHLKEMNHSPRFYNIVASVMPDYKVHMAWLKEHGHELWERN